MQLVGRDEKNRCIVLAGKFYKCPQCSSSVGTRRTRGHRVRRGVFQVPAMQLVGRDEKNQHPPPVRNVWVHARNAARR